MPSKIPHKTQKRILPLFHANLLFALKIVSSNYQQERCPAVWRAGNLISVHQFPKSVFIEISGLDLIYVIWFSLGHLPWEEAGGRCLTSRRVGRPWLYLIAPHLHAVEEALSPLSWPLQYCHERDFRWGESGFLFLWCYTWWTSTAFLCV